MIKIVPHRLQFKFLARTSRDSFRTRDVYYIWVRDGEGHEGFGEISMLPGLSLDDRPDFLDKAMGLGALNELPEPEAYDDFPAIRFGIEQAKISLALQETGIYFPGDFTSGDKKIPINGLIWMGDKEEMLRRIRTKLVEGNRCLKMKIGAISWQAEIDLIKRIRKEFTAEDLELRVDANGAFSRDTVFQKLDDLSRYSIHSIEQPIAPGQHDLMAKICRDTPIPIALDEELIGITSINEKQDLLSTIKPQYIILKPSLLGGFIKSKEWIDIADGLKIGWWVTSALESNIGLAAIAQWTDSLHTTRPQGLGTGQLYKNNIPSPLYQEAGYLGYNPDLPWSTKIITG